MCDNRKKEFFLQNMCRVVYLTIVLLLLVGLDAQRAKKFFRRDYKYIDASESFYKIHTIHKTWQEARDVCASEGATLFYPDDAAEADAVITFWNQTQPFYWVYIGISDLLVKGVFETVDGLQVSEVYTNWEPGEPNDRDGNEDCVIIRRSGYMNDDKCHSKLPFICKKTLASLEWNTPCNTPYTDYMYSEETGKCYKFHLKPRNWTDAYAMCSAEQSYLSVVDSQVEADYLKELTEKAPKENIKGDYIRGVVLLGFHNRNSDGWKTIKGEILEESGFSKWANNQPDGGDKEKCGSLFYNGLYNDISCTTKAFFICEHDVDLLAGSFNDRFGDE